MDDDEALARQLQEIEFSQQGAEQVPDYALFDRTLTDVMKKVQQAEDPLLQAMAMSLLPWDEMQSKAQRTWSLNQADGGAGVAGPCMDVRDYAMVELLLWFKGSFFSWVDQPKCRSCSQPTVHASTGAATPEEAMHQAGRTEVYMCHSCGASTRFPRYNSVEKLLETRCGRCGEWANAFLVFCRAAGYDARYIWDVNDHVWTEFWSEGLKRWVHLDPCEATFDKPLLYEAGWGKSMEYVLGASTAGVVDVTSRYTAKWLLVMARRTRVPESWLAQRLTTMNGALRAGLPLDLAQRCRDQDAIEDKELALRRTGAVSATDLEGLGGRTTGSEAWRQGRGETGGEPAGPMAEPPKAPASTPWTALPTRLAVPGQQQNQSEAGASVFELCGRLMGGGCRASGENGHGEGSARVFDGDVDTKWLDFGAAGPGGTAWIEFRVEPGQAATSVVAYDLISANDCADRDPRNWTLEGLVDNTSAPTDPQQPKQGAAADQWVVLDQQDDVLFDRRQQIRSFWVDGGKAGGVRCRAWRLRISSLRDPAAANSVQLAGWHLYAAGPSWAGHAASDAAAPGSVQSAAQLAHQAVTAVAPLQLGLLQKLLINIATKPTELKFRSVRASKVTSLWSHPDSRALLLAVGFRPVIMKPPAPPAAAPTGAGAMLRGNGVAPAPPQETLAKDVCLVLEAGPQAVARAAAAAQALQEGIITKP